MGNLGAAMAITAGINYAAVRRMKDTFNALDKEHYQKYETMTQCFNREANSRSYRAQVKTAVENGSRCVPYLGLAIKDITFIAIGNHSRDYINWRKLEIFEKVISQLVACHSFKYDFVVYLEVLKYLKLFPAISETEAFACSHYLEPSKLSHIQTIPKILLEKLTQEEVTKMEENVREILRSKGVGVFFQGTRTNSNIDKTDFDASTL